jgi:exosortase A-associated hydrolase 2
VPHPGIRLHPFFLPASRGNLFAVHFQPSRSPSTDRAVVFFAPFAEELNKSRRMVALQARRFAALGLPTLLLDLYGTADSEGDFGEADLDTWRDDIESALVWLRGEGVKAFVFWGVRFGALLAVDAWQRHRDDCNIERLVLWQPVIDGKLHMNQFLRLRLAADLMRPGEKLSTADLRARLEAGDSVEVAGYTLNPRLVAGIDALHMERMCAPGMPRLDWLEVVPNAERSIAAHSRKLIEQCTAHGVELHVRTVTGESFWNTPEITAVPALLDATTASLEGSS